MDDKIIIEKYVNANYSEQRLLENLFTKEFFDKKDDYKILTYYMPNMSRGNIVHSQSASCFSNTQFGGNSEWKIFSIKRLFDNKIFTIGDYLSYTEDKSQKGTLLEIQFEIAPADKGTRRLCFVSDHKTLGKWAQVSNLTHATKPLFTTHDNIELNVGDKFYIVNADMQLETWEGKPFVAVATTKQQPNELQFVDKQLGLDYINLYHRLISIQETTKKLKHLACVMELVRKTYNI